MLEPMIEFCTYVLIVTITLCVVLYGVCLTACSMTDMIFK